MKSRVYAATLVAWIVALPCSASSQTKKGPEGPPFGGGPICCSTDQVLQFQIDQLKREQQFHLNESRDISKKLRTLEKQRSNLK